MSPATRAHHARARRRWRSGRVGAAGTGLLLATASIHLVHDALRRRHGHAIGRAVVGAVVPFVWIGIALGRFARPNSWDVVLAPQIAAVTS